MFTNRVPDKYIIHFYFRGNLIIRLLLCIFFEIEVAGGLLVGDCWRGHAGTNLARESLSFLNVGV